MCIINKATFPHRVTEKSLIATNIYLFEVNNRDSRQRSKICSKLTKKTPGRLQWRRSDVFIVNFKHISHVFLRFLLLTLNKQILAAIAAVYRCYKRFSDYSEVSKIPPKTPWAIYLVTSQTMGHDHWSFPWHFHAFQYFTLLKSLFTVWSLAPTWRNPIKKPWSRIKYLPERFTKKCYVTLEYISESSKSLMSARNILNYTYIMHKEHSKYIFFWYWERETSQQSTKN